MDGDSGGRRGFDGKGKGIGDGIFFMGQVKDGGVGVKFMAADGDGWSRRGAGIRWLERRACSFTAQLQ